MFLMKYNFRLLDKSEFTQILEMMAELNSGLSDEVLNDRLQEMMNQGYECLGCFNSASSYMYVPGPVICRLCFFYLHQIL